MVRIGGEKPAWLERLMEESFFTGCGAHHSRRKNEKNIFCLGCCRSFCPHCLPSHRSHPILQVRRYVYHDVVRLVDLQKLIDCSFIQPYTINGAKVIFLKQRAQSASGSGSASRVQSSRGLKAGSTPNVCFTCDRILQPPFHFCSLSCKVDHMVCQGEELTSSIWISSSSPQSHPPPEFGGGGLRVVDNSGLLDDDDDDDDEDKDNDNDNDNDSSYDDPCNPSSAAPYPANSCSSSRKKKTLASTSTGTGGGGGGGRDRSSATGGSGTSRFLSVFSLSSRRKGAPHRAPLS